MLAVETSEAKMFMVKLPRPVSMEGVGVETQPLSATTAGGVKSCKVLEGNSVGPAKKWNVPLVTGHSVSEKTPFRSLLTDKQNILIEIVSEALGYN